MIVKVDSREVLPLEFPCQGLVSRVSTVGLPFGDYWAALQDKDGNELNEIPIMFERKSIGDLFGTLTNNDNIRRHKEKIRKAEEMDCKLFLIIEGTLSDVEDGYSHSTVDPQALIKTVFTFMVKYGFMPIFCTDRKEMVRFMLHTWEAFGRNFKADKHETN